VSTTDRILFLLKTRGGSQAATLAAALGMSAQAVREHLARLCADGLVQYDDEAEGRGRPRRRWSLTERAQSLFPDSHAELAVELVEAIRAELGEAELERLIRRREQMALATYIGVLADAATLKDRVARLARQRSAEGYMAEWLIGSDGADFVLVENHCPIKAAARACEGFCRAELELFREVLGPQCRVERSEHILAGGRRCSYRITAAGGAAS